MEHNHIHSRSNGSPEAHDFLCKVDVGCVWVELSLELHASEEEVVIGGRHGAEAQMKDPL